MVKNIKGTSSLAGKNVQNSESIGNLTADTIRTTTLVATNATITNLTNTELQTATTNIATNTTNIATNASNVATNATNIATNTTSIAGKQDAITAGDGLSFAGDTLNAEVTQFELDQKQDTLTAGNGIDIVAGLGTTISVDEAELTTKQDVITAGTGLSFTGATLNAEVTQAEVDAKQDTITSSTSLSCADIDLNTNAITGATSITCRSIELHNSTNNLSFLDFGEGDFRFRQLYNQNNNQFIFSIDDATGANPENKMLISRTEVNILNAVLDINSNDITNANSLNGITSTEINYLDGVTSNIQTQLDAKLTDGGTASFTSVSLNGSDLQGKIDDKADAFGLLLPLEIQTAIPNDAIALKYDTSQFTLNGSDELSLTGAIPSLTGDLNMGNNDILNVENQTSATAIAFFANGETVASDNFSLKLRSDGKVKIKSGDLDMNSNKVINVSEVEGSVRIMEFGADPDSVTNNLWGSDNIHDTWATSIDVNGSGMITQSGGIFTITEAGTYTITVNCVIEDQTYNNRIVAGAYLSLNDDTSRFRGATSGTSFALCYLRFDDYGFGESMTFSLTEVFSANDTIRFKTKLGTGSDARNYNDTLDDNKLKWWMGARFQKLLRA